MNIYIDYVYINMYKVDKLFLLGNTEVQKMILMIGNFKIPGLVWSFLLGRNKP